MGRQKGGADAVFAFTNRQIEVFLAVCENRSFRRAADDLCLSEASISHHVRALESQIGYVLFQRVRGVPSLLTADGEQFRANASEFVRMGRKLGRRNLAERERNVLLRISIGRLMLEEYVRPALLGFASKYPNLSFSFTTDCSRGEILQSLKTGELDGVLMAVTSERHLPRSVVLSKAKFGLFGNREMARRARSEGFSALPFLMCDTSVVRKEDQIYLLKSAGVRNPVFTDAYQFPNAAIAMAIEGRGVIATLDSVVEGYDPGGNLRLIRRLPDWERRLLLRPGLDDEISGILTSFFRDALYEPSHGAKTATRPPAIPKPNLATSWCP